MKNSTIFKFLAISLFMCPMFSSAMEKESKISDPNFEIQQLRPKLFELQTKLFDLQITEKEKTILHLEIDQILAKIYELQKTEKKQTTILDLDIDQILTKNHLLMSEKNTEEKYNDDYCQKISSDQIYQLLSFITKDKDHTDFHLPLELVQTITTQANEIIRLEQQQIYEKYSYCLEDTNTLADFIETQAFDNKNIKSTIDILQLCLDYSGKSLSDIPKWRLGYQDRTPLGLAVSRARASYFTYDFQNKIIQYCFNVLRQLTIMEYNTH